MTVSQGGMTTFLFGSQEENNNLIYFSAVTWVIMQNRTKQFHQLASTGFLHAVFPLLLPNFGISVIRPDLDSTCLKSWNHVVFIPLRAEGNNFLKSHSLFYFMKAMWNDFFESPLHANVCHSLAKPLLDVLLVIYINYLYCSTTHEFRNLVQTYEVTLLGSPLLLDFGAVVRITRLSVIKQCQFTSLRAQLRMWLTLMGTSLYLSASQFSIVPTCWCSAMASPCACGNEMAGLPCDWGYHSLTYCTAIKEKSFQGKNFSKYL